MRALFRPLPFVGLVVALAAPAGAVTSSELSAAVSPAAPTSADLVEVTVFEDSPSRPLRPIDVEVAAAPPGAGHDHVVRVRMARFAGAFVWQAMDGGEFIPIGPSFALGPLEPGEYLVEAAWDDQRREVARFTVTGPPPGREGVGPFARPLPVPRAHEIVIEDVGGLGGCAPRTFELVGTEIDGALVHVFFEERRFEVTCAGLTAPEDVRAVVGPLPPGASYTAVVWYLPDTPVLRPQILWGTAALPSAEEGGTCAASGAELCLGGRFRVRATWSTAEHQGTGRPVRLTRDTGTFWFFDRDNVEVVVKTLDACAPFGRHWVFLSGLTDVEVEIEVIDVVTGARRTYHNPAGTHFQPIFDTDAFTCP